ncbi:inositol monophosphatase family protein, partial [Staphylococcus hominis]|uniref:inositol monophosphatase family protein n=1 Tax=Staphylococcus hominis TaxID=1290 RepID=UPI0037095FC0
APNKLTIIINQQLNIQTKSNPNHLLTNLHKPTQNYIYHPITHTYPQHPLIPQQAHPHHLTHVERLVSVLHPIDRTLNFVH